MICENCKEEMNPIPTNGYWVCPNCGFCLSEPVFGSEFFPNHETGLGCAPVSHIGKSLKWKSSAEKRKARELQKARMVESVQAIREPIKAKAVELMKKLNKMKKTHFDTVLFIAYIIEPNPKIKKLIKKEIMAMKEIGNDSFYVRASLVRRYLAELGVF